MKRDLELIREILSTIENFKYGSRITVKTFMKTDDIDEFCNISFHIALLLDEDMIEIMDEPILTLSNPCEDYFVDRLTSRGCDYLDSVRNDTVWQETKGKIGSLINSVSLATISTVAQKIISQQLGI